MISKLITPGFVLISSLLILFSNLRPEGKENLLLALISGYFGNCLPGSEQVVEKVKDKVKRLI